MSVLLRGAHAGDFRRAFSCETNCINRITNFSPMSNSDIGEIAFITITDVSKKCIIHYIYK